MPPSKVLTGAKAVLAINGTIVAYASNCSYNWAHNVSPIELLGQPEVNEHTELGMTVDFTCTQFRVSGKSARNLGFQPTLAALLQQSELSATIIDKTTNTPLLIISGVKLTGRAGTVDARGVWTETLSFVGRLAADSDKVPA